MIKVFSVVSSLAKSYGGPAYTVAALADSLAEKDIKQSIAAISSQSNGNIFPKNKSIELTLVPVGGSNVQKNVLSFSPEIYTKLKRSIEKIKPDIIHCNGVWAPINHYSMFLARQFRIPY